MVDKSQNITNVLLFYRETEKQNIVEGSDKGTVVLALGFLYISLLSLSTLYVGPSSLGHPSAPGS